ncbi:MAG: outer membrane protein nutrient binding [Chitinophagaceae bacterium]|nr:outer membrane protein nutrient binding [Chitinophagaceae bacterium]
MKKKFIYISTAFLLIIGTACQKKLDINPTSSIDQQNALNTSSGVLTALNGAYFDVGNAWFYGGDIGLFADLLGDAGELRWNGTYQQMTQMYNKAIPKNSSFVASQWLQGYKAINDVNNVLSALSVVDATAKDRVEGEAKFIRGSVYFDLVRMYAKAWNDGNPANNPGVPLVLTPTTGITDANKVTRNKVSEVYDQVIKDLTDAEAKLPATNGFYATKYAAAAMLARVYLQKGDYTNAVQAANRVITSGKYTLTSTFAGAFPASASAQVPNTSEDVFAIQVTTTQLSNDYYTFYSPSSRGDIDIKPAHLALYETGDARKAFFTTSGGSVYTLKHNSRYANVRVIRLAEMYLIRAESNFRLVTTVGDTPLNDINKIRTRSGLPALTSAGLDLNKILMERKLELAFEGQTLHDIKRLQGNVGLLPWNSPKLIFPIPERETIANANLVQNEGY